jgi:hypothetical protein
VLGRSASQPRKVSKARAWIWNSQFPRDKVDSENDRESPEKVALSAGSVEDSENAISGELQSTTAQPSSDVQTDSMLSRLLSATLLAILFFFFSLRRAPKLVSLYPSPPIA